MTFVAIVTALALIEYIVLSALTAQARATYNVEAPATTGHPIFERWYRVQQNTVEQLVLFLPALYLCAIYASTRLAGLLGLVFIVGRAIYARSYVADPASRSLGFGITFAASALLLLAGLFGAIF